MKATGIVRRVDDLGRLVIPKALRQTMGVKEGEPMEIFTTVDGIVIKPYKSGCSCCGCTENLVDYNSVSLCQTCIDVFAQKSRTK